MDYEQYIDVYGERAYEPDVTVYMLTYNHERFIRDALEGVFGQKGKIKYEVVIIDDASNDGSRPVIEEYLNKYGNLTYIRIKENSYRSSYRNKLFYYIKQKYMTGKYIAMCECDDLWIDEYKLKRQFDFMENHTDCSMYMHNGLWVDYNDPSNISFFPGNPYYEQSDHYLTPKEIICMPKSHPPTASFFYRSELLREPFFFFDVAVGDYPLQLNALNKGKVWYDSRIMSVYRFRTEGGYTKKNENNDEMYVRHVWSIVNFLLKYDRYTEHVFSVPLSVITDGFLSNWLMKFSVFDDHESVVRAIEKKGYIDSEVSGDALNRIKAIASNVTMLRGVESFIAVIYSS